MTQDMNKDRNENKKKEYLKLWRQKNKDKLKEYRKLWDQNNKDKIKEYCRKYYLRSTELNPELHVIYREKSYNRYKLKNSEPKEPKKKIEEPKIKKPVGRPRKY